MDVSAKMEEPLEVPDVKTKNGPSGICPKQSTIDHVALNASDNDFKSQNEGPLVLSLDEKRNIVGNILNDGHLKFLYVFGKYLLEDHLEFFKSENINNYEINFHIHRLSRLINSKKVICKNRRYQAMLELLKSDYFSDNEMRNREPLLWEQLVGQYLSEEEKSYYDNQYVAQNSLTEVLFEQIDRDNRDDLKRKQQINEVQELDEDDDSNDSDNENNNDDNDDGDNENNDDDVSDEPSMAVAVNKPSGFWGEYSKPKNKTVKIGKHRWKKDHFHNVKQPCNTNELSENEKLLLLDEFKSHMIHKFLNGQEDFDYNNVDNNPEYDNLVIEGMDEEEKYFDSESPVEEITATEDGADEKMVSVESDVEEDELDIYMSMLEKNEMTDSVADKLKNL